MKFFYVYVYLDPRKPGIYNYGLYEFNYEPFYVGKGKEYRYKRIDKYRSNYFRNKINKIKESGFETIKIKLRENIEEIKSFELEIELIELIGRKILKKGPLINIADGGGGSSGYKWTEEQLQKQRKEYSIIKKSFEREKCKLRTEEKDYKNKYTKLEYECQRGHKHSISWNSFQQGKRCPYCVRNKIDFPDIKETFERRKYKLLTKEKNYRNCYTKLEYECPKGHKHSISWNNFQQGKGCPYCVRNKIDFPDIRREFEKRKCKLSIKEKDYKNAHQKLEYECPKGHKHSIAWNHFQQRKNNYCPKCNKLKKITE